jgi:hypothetical protein
MPKNIEQKGGESKEEKRKKIRALGFSNEEVIEYLTKNFNSGTLQGKIQNLQSAGFENPISLIEKHPPIASLNINRVIQSLQSMGFTNPISLIEKHPPIAGYNINRVIQSLQSMGFTNPIYLIEKFPPIAGYDINRVIQALQSMGFTNPISLIEKFPKIACYNIDRVKRRIQLIQRLNMKFQLQLNPIEIIENNPKYVGYDQRRIFFFLRIASFYNVDEKFYRNLITKNPFVVFNILYELYLQNQISDQDEFRRLIDKIRSYPKEIKQTIQNEIKTNLPQIIENLRQKQDDPNARFLLKLISYLEDLLEKEEKRKRKKKT